MLKTKSQIRVKTSSVTQLVSIIYIINFQFALLPLTFSTSSPKSPNFATFLGFQLGLIPKLKNSRQNCLFIRLSFLQDSF